jgi:hypothetical protein
MTWPSDTVSEKAIKRHIIAESKSTSSLDLVIGIPLLYIFSCIPCEEQSRYEKLLFLG